MCSQVERVFSHVWRTWPPPSSSRVTMPGSKNVQPIKRWISGGDCIETVPLIVLGVTCVACAGIQHLTSGAPGSKRAKPCVRPAEGHGWLYSWGGIVLRTGHMELITPRQGTCVAWHVYPDRPCCRLVRHSRVRRPAGAEGECGAGPNFLNSENLPSLWCQAGHALGVMCRRRHQRRHRDP